MGPLIPVPTALVSDLVHSLSTSMVSDENSIQKLVADPPEGLTTVRQAIVRALAPAEKRAVANGSDTTRVPDGEAVGTHRQGDPLTLADTDASWAGDQE